jgi:hypothetical protein
MSTPPLNPNAPAFAVWPRFACDAIKRPPRAAARLEMPRETVRRHMGRLVGLGLFERAEDQTFVPTKELREVEIERALRLLRQGTAGLL